MIMFLVRLFYRLNDNFLDAHSFVNEGQRLLVWWINIDDDWILAVVKKVANVLWYIALATFFYLAFYLGSVLNIGVCL